MFSSKKIRELALTAGSIIAACVLLAGCTSEEKASTPPQQPVHNIVVTDQFTREVQPRNPDRDNGEVQRVLKRDSLGRLRQIEVSFKGGHRGIILKNEQGVTEKVSLTMSDGQVREATPGTDRAISEATLKMKDGKLLLRILPGLNGTTRNSLYFDDGTTEEFYEVVEGNIRTAAQMQADGKFIYQISINNGVKLWAKYYDQQGALLYEEKPENSARLEGPTARSQGRFGAMNYYEGTVYGADGRPTHKVYVHEGPFDNFIGRVDKVEVLNEDGTVAETISGAPQNHSQPLGRVKDITELLKAKRDVFENLNRARSPFVVLESDMSYLLQDKTQ